MSRTFHPVLVSLRRFSRRAALGVAAGVVGVGLAAQPSAAHAENYFKLSAHHDALVLDVQGGSTKARAPIVQWYDNGGSNQHWTLPLGLDESFDARGNIRNQRSGMCLTTDGVAGHQLFQYPCQTRADGRPVAGQNWWVKRVNVDGIRPASTWIQSPDFDLVVDVSGYSYTPGAAIDAWYPVYRGYAYYSLNQVFEQFKA
jgi:hypothetical protein